MSGKCDLAEGCATSAVTTMRSITRPPNEYRRRHREFRKITKLGVHVTPRIELNPMTTCTRIGTRQFFKSCERDKKIQQFQLVTVFQAAKLLGRDAQVCRI